MKKTLKILITGSSGFLGSQIVNTLKKKDNIELILIVRKKIKTYQNLIM